MLANRQAILSKCESLEGLCPPGFRLQAQALGMRWDGPCHRAAASVFIPREVLASLLPAIVRLQLCFKKTLLPYPEKPRAITSQKSLCVSSVTCLPCSVSPDWLLAGAWGVRVLTSASHPLSHPEVCLSLRFTSPGQTQDI